MTKKFTVKDMVLCALLAAMTGILSQIGIPIGEIPINLALFSVYLAGGLLGSYKGAVSMVVYVMMGAVDVYKRQTQSSLVWRGYRKNQSDPVGRTTGSGNQLLQHENWGFGLSFCGWG